MILTMRLLNLLFICAALISISCQSTSKTTSLQNDTTELLGSVKDQEGCLTSAGYTWSQLKEECIRPFELGIELYNLNTSTSYQTAAYILVDSIQREAEVFVAEANQSVLLEKDSTDTYTNGKFNLTKENFLWTLSLNNIKLYQERK